MYHSEWINVYYTERLEIEAKVEENGEKKSSEGKEYFWEKGRRDKSL